MDPRVGDGEGDRPRLPLSWKILSSRTPDELPLIRAAIFCDSPLPASDFAHFHRFPLFFSSPRHPTTLNLFLPIGRYTHTVGVVWGCERGCERGCGLALKWFKPLTRRHITLKLYKFSTHARAFVSGDRLMRFRFTLHVLFNSPLEYRCMLNMKFYPGCFAVLLDSL